MEPLLVRPLKADEWEIFRNVRLAGLKEAPHAFGSRYEDQVDSGPDEWRARLAARAVQFIVERGAQVVGTAGAAIEDGEASLVSMWVSPSARGQGAGDLLVGAVSAWAREAGFGRLALYVMEGNETAQRLYARHGFELSGRRQPTGPDRPGSVELEMILRFVTPAETE